MNGVGVSSSPSPPSLFGFVPSSESSAAGWPLAPSAVARTVFVYSGAPVSSPGSVSRSTVNTSTKLSPGCIKSVPSPSTNSELADVPSHPAVLMVGMTEPAAKFLRRTTSVGPANTESKAAPSSALMSSVTSMFDRLTVPVFSTTTTYSTRN